MIKDSYRLLAISPHPDDVEIFSGGTIVKYARRGIGIYVLYITTGYAGIKGKVTDPVKGVIPQSALTGPEISSFIQRRREESKEAGRIMGVSQVNFLNLRDMSFDKKLKESVKSKIKEINPHVIISLNEAGTTTHPDHTWATVAVFNAILDLLKTEYGDLSDDMKLPSEPKLALRRYFTSILPQPDRLERYSEIDVLDEKLTAIDIVPFITVKKEAILAHQSQLHLLKTLDEKGIFDDSKELYYERINLGMSAKGKTDLFTGIENSPRSLQITVFPHPLITTNVPEYKQTILNFTQGQSFNSSGKRRCR